MAYDVDYQDDEAPRDPPAAPAPALQAFREAYDQPGIAPIAREWADEVVTRVNDYNQRKSIADSVTRAGEEFVANNDDFKSGLVSGVQNDPHFVFTALDLVPPTLGMMIEAMPNMPEDAAAHHAALAQHMQGEIAAAAVTSAAEQDEGLARSFLDNPRIRKVLGENAGPLDSYITIQAQARAIDTEAEVAELQQRAAHAADRSAINYLGALHNPTTGGLQFPPGWNQAIMADLSLPPPAKVALAGLYGRLRAEGDAPASDPYLIADAASRISEGAPPTVADLALAAGRGLTVADAMLLLGGTGPVSTGMRREFGQLASTLNAAQRMLAPPENGPAGASAFSRFANWLLPEYRARGPGSLNPNAENSILAGGEIQAFAPTMTDIADGIVVEPLASYAAPANRIPGTRIPLKDIFRGDEAPRPRYPRDPGEVRAPRGYRASGPGGDFVPVEPVIPPGTFYGVEAPMPSQRLRGGSQRINPEDPEPTEVLTDTGIKQLTAADLRRSTSGPRPRAAPSLTEEQQRAAQEGRPINAGAASPGRAPLVPTRPMRSPRRRR